MSTEQELIEQSKAGDRKSFEVLYRSTVSRVYALCLRMCSDEALAEDLTQDAFVMAWRKLGSFKGDSSFATWMYRVGTNVVIDHMRSKKKWQMINYDELEEMVSVEKKDKDMDIDLERAIDMLPEQARAVFLLHEFLGFQHNEIADMAGLAVGSCKAHLHRARKLIKQVISNEA